MSNRLPWRRLALAMLLGCALTSAAAAEDVPKDAAKPVELTPNECVSEDSGFKMHGKSPAYVVELTNKCERRLRCKVNVYVTNAFGPTQGQATLVLAPHAAGDAARKTYALKVKALTGSAQGSRQCSPI